MAPGTITESGGQATVTATLDHGSSAATTVTVGATAGTNAAPGDFRLSVAKTLTIAVGSTRSSGTVTVTAVDNSKDEATKTVVAGTAANSQGITQPASVDLTITDDDGAPALSIDAPRVVEGNASTTALTFTVRLSPASGQQVTVSYADAATGTATAGTDYAAITGGTLTFAAGETSRTIAVARNGRYGGRGERNHRHDLEQSDERGDGNDHRRRYGAAETERRRAASGADGLGAEFRHTDGGGSCLEAREGNRGLHTARGDGRGSPGPPRFAAGSAGRGDAHRVPGQRDADGAGGDDDLHLGGNGRGPGASDVHPRRGRGSQADVHRDGAGAAVSGRDDDRTADVAGGDRG